MNPPKPVRQLSDDTVVFAYAAQLFTSLSRPEQLKVIRIMESMENRKQEENKNECCRRNNSKNSE